VEERRAVEETADGKSVALGFGYFATQFSTSIARVSAGARPMDAD